VGIHSSSKKIAIEIMIEGQEKEITNIIKDGEHYDEIICCAEDKDELNGLKAILEKELDEGKTRKVQFKLLSEFFL
jgi:hypothetical protein